ncbi:MAG TPA: hypothetical protein PLA69_07730 [Flavobacterium sp.]|nr:hypothetical protein [Flavobacterium sp.]
MEREFTPQPAHAQDLQPREDLARRTKKKLVDHHVNRKYRVFSNHSSYGDSPHTVTSF